MSSLLGSAIESALASWKTDEELAGPYARDPRKWVHDQFQVDPDPWQGDALQALAEDKNVAVRSGHGVGKTAWLSWVVLWWLDTRIDPTVPCAAPTGHQLEDLLWPEMDRWLARSAEIARTAKHRDGVHTRLSWQASRVSRIGSERRHFATQIPAGPENKPENLAGFHAGDLLFVIDEASGIGDRNMAVVSGALTTQGARLVMGGNPTRASGYFIRRFALEPEGWYLATVSSAESSRVSDTWVEEMRREWGEDSDEFRVRVLGLPPRGDARGFIPSDIVEQAMELELTAEGPLILGVDVARYGADNSAICLRRGSKILGIKTRHGQSNPRVARWVLDLIEQHTTIGEIATVNVDDGGVGGGVTDLLKVARREGVRMTVNGLTFGGAGDKWYTTNAGVWWHRLRRLFQERALQLPKDDNLRVQLTDRTAAVNMSGRTVLESKDHMRARGVHSPDKADALALTVAGGGQGSMFSEFWKGQTEAARERNVVSLEDRQRERQLARLLKTPRNSPNRLGLKVVTTTRCEHRWDPRGFCKFCGELSEGG